MPGPLKVLYFTPEASPFAKTGGLGDVAGSLPKALHRHGLIEPPNEAFRRRDRFRPADQ